MKPVKNDFLICRICKTRQTIWTLYRHKHTDPQTRAIDNDIRTLKERVKRL